MIIDVPASGQRLKPDAYAPRLRPFAELSQIIRDPVNATKGVRGEV